MPARILLAKFINRKATSIDDAFECADGNGLASMHRDNHLPPIIVPPFLVAALLADLIEAVFSQNTNHFIRVTNWKSFAHVSATSNTLAPGGNETADGSNQSSNASFAFRIASASVSPAEAQPGSSGKNADQRLISVSCSTTSRSFIASRYESPQSLASRHDAELLPACNRKSQIENQKFPFTHLHWHRSGRTAPSADAVPAKAYTVRHTQRCIKGMGSNVQMNPNTQNPSNPTKTPVAQNRIMAFMPSLNTGAFLGVN